MMSMQKVKGKQTSAIDKGAGIKGAAAGGRPRVKDARLKLISKHRSEIVDARDVIAKMAKNTDARQKLQKIRNLKQGKLDVKTTQNGAITITTTTKGQILLTTKRKEDTKIKKQQQQKNAKKNPLSQRNRAAVAAAVAAGATAADTGRARQRQRQRVPVPAAALPVNHGRVRGGGVDKQSRRPTPQSGGRGGARMNKDFNRRMSAAEHMEGEWLKGKEKSV
jgi:hypothetical protein